MKKYFTIIGLFFTLSAFGQSNILIGQYFQLLPVFAPGLTGANDYLDIRMGTRRQWSDFDGAPKTYFINAAGVVNIGKTNPHEYNSIRVSDLSPYTKRGTKIGLGAYIFDDKLGGFKQFESMVTGAVHIPVTSKIYLSMGVSLGIYNARLDISNVNVLRPQNDFVYQDYLQNGANSNYFKLNSGIAAYSDRFYFSYSAMNLVNTLMKGNNSLVDGSPEILHNFVGGYRITLDARFEMIPNAYIRYSRVMPLLYDMGVRVRYEQNLYVGMSYRNDKSFIGMIGFILNDKYNFGYSFEKKSVDYGGIDLNSHELVLGIQLFNNKKYTSLW